MAKLTKRQTEILTLIQTHLETTGSPPTRAEIAKTMGFKSPNAAEDHLRALARKGAIELIPSTSRGIRLIQNTGIPVITRIATGQPLLSEQNIKTSYKIDRGLFQPSIDFFKRVHTSEWKHLGILENDYLAIHKVDKTYPFQKGQFIVVREANELAVQHLEADLDCFSNTLEGIVVGVIRPLLTPSLG